MSNDNRVRISKYQPLGVVRGLLAVLDGTPRALVSKLHRDILPHCSHGSEWTDWSDPEWWIDRRLPADTAAFAPRLWKESDQRVNPRHLTGADTVIRKYALACVNEDGVYHLTPAGRAFVRGDPAEKYRIDEGEGTLFILELISRRPGAESGDLLPDWKAFLEQCSTMPPRSAYDALRRRLRDLADRQLVDRTAGTYRYTINAAGLAWVRGAAAARDRAAASSGMPRT